MSLENQSAQYITRPSKIGNGLLYERAFDLSARDFSLDHILNIIGFTKIKVTARLEGSTNGNVVVNVSEGNAKSIERQTTVEALTAVTVGAPDQSSTNIEAYGAYLGFRLDVVAGTDGKVVISICANN